VCPGTSDVGSILEEMQQVSADIVVTGKAQVEMTASKCRSSMNFETQSPLIPHIKLPTIEHEMQLLVCTFCVMIWLLAQKVDFTLGKL